MPRLLVLLLPLAGCLTTRVETMSHPTTVHVRLSQTCATTSLEVYDEYANYVPVAIVDGKADVDVPGMRGGYDERRGTKSRVSDPTTYPAIRLHEGHETVTVLSLQDLNALPKDAEGRAVIAVRCSVPRTVPGS
jgi:hypothetical protein